MAATFIAPHSLKCHSELGSFLHHGVDGPLAEGDVHSRALHESLASLLDLHFRCEPKMGLPNQAVARHPDQQKHTTPTKTQNHMILCSGISLGALKTCAAASASSLNLATAFSLKLSFATWSSSSVIFCLYVRFPQFQPSNFQFENLKSEPINCGCVFDTMSDFNVPGSPPQKTLYKFGNRP